MARKKPSRLRGSVTQNFAASSYRDQEEGGGLPFVVRACLLLLVLATIIAIPAWLWHIGWPQKQFSAFQKMTIQLTQKADFAIADIIVEGRKQTDKRDLTLALGVTAGAPMLLFNPTEALERVEKLPWVAHAVIVRRLPDTIYVKITEREPTARWQHGGRTVIIDREGHELPNAEPDKFRHLPLVIGADAPHETVALLDALHPYPTLTNLMLSAVRVSDRRWNLYMKPKVLVKLPEKGIDSALQRLTQLVFEQKILERDIVAIDLRLPDRLYLESGNKPETTEQK